jgi:hypothetical protein
VYYQLDQHQPVRKIIPSNQLLESLIDLIVLTGFALLFVTGKFNPAPIILQSHARS